MATISNYFPGPIVDNYCDNVVNRFNPQEAELDINPNVGSQRRPALA